jgi:hypothetical protein
MTAMPHPANAPQPAWALLRGYAEMLLAMLLGMATLSPQWVLVISRPADDTWR